MNAEEGLSKLKEDVKKFAEKHIKNIKCVDEIFRIQKFPISKNHINKESNSYMDLLRYKKALQLMLNAYNDHDFYRDFLIKDSSQPALCYECIGRNDIWKCVACPKIEEVIKALYNYIVCFLSLDIEKVVFEKCTFCDGAINVDEQICSICLTSVDEMIVEQTPNTSIDITNNGTINIERNNEKENEWEGEGNDRYDSKWRGERNDGYVGEWINSDNSMSVAHEVDLGSNGRKPVLHNDGIIARDICQGEKVNQWKCGKCEYFNNYEYANCKVCRELCRDGTWTCGRCTLENSCKIIECTACEYKNADLVGNTATGGGGENSGVLNDKHTTDVVVVVEDRKDVKNDTIERSQWKCGKCGLKIPYSDIICGVCSASRVGNGKWQCYKCTLVNDCKNVACTVCEEKNDLLLAKYCTKCKVNVVTPGGEYCDGCERYSNTKYKPIQWRCQYPKCEEYNGDVEEYCHICRIQRNYSRARGDIVKMWYKGKESIMWICYKCHKRNKDSELVCVDCQETRFKKRYCKNCNEYNDGTTNNCDKCYQKL